MRAKMPLLLIFGMMMASNSYGQSAFAEEEFTEDDFAQFFSLIEGGKISRDKMSERCADQSIGFTFVGEDIRHEDNLHRIYYNVSRENASVDGRTLRAKHSNASFGEWTGAVFKPLCPGLYSVSVDFSAANAGNDDAGDVHVHVYLRRSGENRPGQKIVTATMIVAGPRGTGHATLALTLNSGDEISTWSEGTGNDPARTLESVTFTAYKIVHLENLVEEIDMDAWTEDIMMLKKQNQ
jgi:hypothetical protein